ncbi:MAG TPA: hypothetical protein VMX54_12630 [Vicinamibacteria bacterium]|nr:hypothetical protein [Vicinamibacteria bacterium]
MSLGKYSILVTGVALTALALAWPLGLQRLESDARAAVLFGAAVALLNTIAAHGLVRWSTGRSTTAFFRAVLGGMVGRMALMLAAVLAGLLWLRLPQLPLAASLLGGFVAFLVLELTIAHRAAGRPAPASR